MKDIAAITCALFLMANIVIWLKYAMFIRAMKDIVCQEEGLRDDQIVMANFSADSHSAWVTKRISGWVVWIFAAVLVWGHFHGWPVLENTGKIALYTGMVASLMMALMIFLPDRAVIWMIEGFYAREFQYGESTGTAFASWFGLSLYVMSISIIIGFLCLTAV